MKQRMTPAFFVAVLALVLAAAGAGYAGGMVTSAQIKDHTIAAIDIKPKTITGGQIKGASVPGSELKNASVPLAKLKLDCKSTSIKLGGVCMTKAPKAPVAIQAAINACDAMGGRLPTYAEDRLLVVHSAQGHHGFDWSTDGMLSQYEWTSTYVLDGTLNVVTTDYTGNYLTNDMMPTRGYHCVTYP